MASSSLYPPIVDNYMPAFIASGQSNYCRLYFSLSKYSSSTSPIKSIHISVVKQSNGQSVVKRVDTLTRFRSTGIIIINSSPIPVPDKSNLYYIDILNDDIKIGDDAGWKIGWIYKMQIRLSSRAYDGTVPQAAWLNMYASDFSEWSTYCVTKAIGKPTIKIPLFKDYNSDVSQKEYNYNLPISFLEFSGSYENEDDSETLYSYKAQLYNSSKEILEDSGTIYTNQYYNPNQFYYLFKTELKNNYSYTFKLTYSTINKYEQTLSFDILITQAASEETQIEAITVENVDYLQDDAFKEKFHSLTTISEEEEDGRLAIKLFSTDQNRYSGNICLRRADSKDSYTTWTDIKIINCIDTVINDLDIIYDNTIESGVWYKYGIQTISTKGIRGVLNVMRNTSLREFEYAFLIGEGGRQLKMKYDNTMNSYIYNYNDGKQDTLGGQYPFISRNGATKYRTIPVNGLISFNMDENKLFTSDEELYKYSSVIKLYQNRRIDEKLEVYDYKREFDFREKVLGFLYDGKPKLYKSATEGNLIVRLMQVSAQPNQSLNRLIFAFTSTGYEIAAATMENYLKYGFYEVGEYITEINTKILKVGQLDLNIKVGDDIIEEIYKKYDFSNRNMAGKRISIDKICYLSINFEGDPLRVINSGGSLVSGNNFTYNNKLITVTIPFRNYTFDSLITFTKGDNIKILGGIDTAIQEVPILVDFFYAQEEEPYVEKEPDAVYSNRGVGQICQTYKAGDNIYNDVYKKYYYDWDTAFRKLSQLIWSCMEADPGNVFLFKDGSSSEGEYHEINETGILNFEGLGNVKDIQYIGKRLPNGNIDRTTKVDVLVDYIYYTLEGTYRI